MVQFLIILALSIALLAVLGGWRRDRRLLSESGKGSQGRDAERTAVLEKANEDLKASQADLQRRWQYLAEAQRLSHSGTFGWKVHSGELIWSDETYKILGFARQTNPTLDLVFDRVHPADRNRLQQIRDRATQSGMDLDVDHRILLPDGVIKFVHVVAHAGRDNSGDLEYIGVVTDVTERRRADEEREALSHRLQESKARLEEAQRVAQIGHYEWNLVANRVTWSAELYRIYGLPPQEGSIDMAMVREMMHPDDREHVFGAVEDVVRSGVNAAAEHRVVRSTGEVRTVQAIGTVKRDASGRAYEIFGTVQDISDSKRAEEERQALSRDLQESKAWLEEAQHVAHVGYWVWDLQTNRLIWSDETYRIFGLTPQEGPIDLDKVREMIHPDDREMVFRTAENAANSGTRADCEHRLFRPNGEMRVVHSLGDLKKDSSGRPHQIFGTTQDITERKHAEEALQQNQFYLREGQRLAHMGSWAFNAAGHYWSDELYKIYGLDPKSGAPTVEQYLALVHPQDRTVIAETIKRMQEQHCGFDQIERIVRPDGQLRYIRAVAVPVFEKGVFTGFVGTTMDVTEQELLTQELRREKAYLAEAQSLTHIGSWATNFETKRMFHVSDEVYRLHGFEPNQGPSALEGFWNTIHPEDEPVVRTTLENAIRTRTDYDISEFRVRHADGSIRFLRTIGHHNPSEEVGYYVGITMDITERKRAEEERERLHQLEADLAHINRVNMMGELAAALAHEIKQPIAAAVANAGACLGFLEGEHPDILEAREAASGTIACGRRAAEIIDHVRSVFRKNLPQREPVDLNELIREIALLLKSDIRRNSVKVNLELSENLPKVVGDRVQLEQVLMNLMLNAIEAMRDTNGNLTIASNPTEDGHLLISVSDTGVGIPTDKVDRIFDTFFTTKPQGTGMGLAISRSIVESHGGRLWATSNSGRGSTFRFTLPPKV
ncbi:MAG TPA: PAS domain-containing protein [Candidatus Acidoferrales bacterium]|nr:PAS domain-containing protein [Candidatus Acidoferrales bacterium]